VKKEVPKIVLTP